MKVIKLIMLLSIIITSVMGAQTCSFTYETSSKDQVVPVGYEKHYILGKQTKNPIFATFTQKIKKLDSGYVYCAAVKNKDTFECLDNTQSLYCSNDIKYVTVNGKSKKYFQLIKDSAKITYNIPVVKRYLDGHSLEVTLLQHMAIEDKPLCTNSDARLKINYIPFTFSYVLEPYMKQKSSEYYPSILAKLTVKNPAGVEMKVTDLYKNASLVFSDKVKEIQLETYKNSRLGFCINNNKPFSEAYEINNNDYSCKHLSFKDSCVTANGQFQIKKFIRSIDNNHYIQVAATRNKKSCMTPFEVLSPSSYIQLTSKGYFPKFRDRKRVSYLLVGPFKSSTIKTNLKRIKRIISDAVIYAER